MRNYCRIICLLTVVGSSMLGVAASQLSTLNSQLFPRLVGVLGNSGTREKPVLFGDVVRGDQSQTGPVYDAERGVLYQSVGAERMNVYTLDGRLEATYAIPKGFFRVRNDPLVRVGDRLHFRRNREVWTLPLNAPDGTAATKANCPLAKVKLLSSSARNGEIAVLLEDNTLHLWNVATGTTRQIGADLPNYTNILDWNPDGDLFAVREHTVYKIANGKSVTADGFPKRIIDRGVSINAGGMTGGALWATGQNGTLMRFDAKTCNPSPGVTFGGRGGHTLNYNFGDDDLGGGSGVAHLSGDYYAVGASRGAIVIFKWDPLTRQCTRVRRIGALPDVPLLGLSSDGNVEVGGFVWRWTDGEDAPIHSSWRLRAREVAASARVGDGTSSLRLGSVWHNGDPIVEIGVFSETGKNRPCRADKFWGSFKNVVGVAATKNRAFVMDRDGTLRVFRYRFDRHNFDFIAEKSPRLVLAKPLAGAVTGFAHLDAARFVLAAGGELVFVAPTDDGLKEVARAEIRFSPDCRLAADERHVVVSEQGKDRVTILSRDGKTVATIAVAAPGAVAVNGNRLVVHETAAQRVLKYEW